MIFYLPKSAAWIIIHIMNDEVSIHVRVIRRILRDALANYKRFAPADAAADVAIRHYRQLLVRDAEEMRRQVQAVEARQ